MLSMIAAMGTNRVIGSQGRLPWRLADDLQLFKNYTTGHAVIMGRKTFQALHAPLPNRTNIVLTANPRFTAPPQVHVVHSIKEALHAAGDDPEPFIAGGGQIYRLFLPAADRLYLTIADLAPPGDATFPELDDTWISTHEEHFPKNDRNQASFRFLILERAAPSRT